MNRPNWQSLCLRGQSRDARNACEPRPVSAFHSTADIQGELMLQKISLRTPLFFSRALALWLTALAIPALASAQQPSGAGTSNAPSTRPDSPQPKQEDSVKPGGGTNRFVGYVTSRSIVFPDIATNPLPLSPGGKFKIFVNQAISPAYVLGSGVSAAVNQANNSPGSTGQGWEAYGTRVGYSMARASSTSFFGTFVFASILRQDPRFFPESHPSFLRALKLVSSTVRADRRENHGALWQRSRVAFRGKHIQGILADPLSRYAFAEGYAESRQPVAVASSLHFSM